MNDSDIRGLVAVSPNSAYAYRASILRPPTDYSKLENVLGQAEKKVIFTLPDKSQLQRKQFKRRTKRSL